MVDILGEEKGKDGRRIIKVAKENLLALMRDLKAQGYNLSLTTGVDYVDHIEVVYHLYNLEKNEYIIVKTETTDNHVPSLTPLWNAANWDEREEYDLVGIVFDGHPYLKRLFLPEGWVGHPLRKNYDLSKAQYVNMDEEGNDYVTFDPEGGW
ncbi:NADH dehydrogenase I chain C [Thermoplasma volcanium GSS1]|uniref:NADH dehydrogenase I chain C n=1 Tax=Thermoplasma volcanium (strain ATCC 51530 / DSM 4299 / JCM 9571 / NBRC 15438 / GSS1) TaxID=273116 RepID=Q979M2_THEVO|nr:NADH-quinone oxidoreductase subunit C [Thermoplasma volcanium]BAB60280.1 NADH dehydrogenase I chain C [Thermoplasma volcanium GSS1]